MEIYCIGCQKKVEARLTNGKEHYPNRSDLYEIPFWHCDTCGSWDGKINKIIVGPRGGFRSVIFGDKVFTERHLNPLPNALLDYKSDPRVVIKK